MISFPYGFRIRGSTRERRRLVDAARALAGYCSCDDRAEVGGEGYLLAFEFGEDFRQLLESTGSTAGFLGECLSKWLWFDIDAEGDLERAATSARRLCTLLNERYRLSDAELLIFFSGAKGFHLGLPTTLWSPAPSGLFHKAARMFAEHLAKVAGVAIDNGVYDKVRAFRAPNSKHPKTGLHKRRLLFNELMGLTLDQIVELAREPMPFDLPRHSGRNDQAVTDWLDAEKAVERQAAAQAERRVASNGAAKLNRATLAFIRDGAEQGDRHRLLFSAAANLAEFGCEFDLAFALLCEAALDSGLPPKEIRRQVECGLASAQRGPR